MTVCRMQGEIYVDFVEVRSVKGSSLYYRADAWTGYGGAAGLAAEMIPTGTIGVVMGTRFRFLGTENGEKTEFTSGGPEG